MFIVTLTDPDYITFVEPKYLLLISNIIIPIFYMCLEDKKLQVREKS